MFSKDLKYLNEPKNKLDLNFVSCNYSQLKSSDFESNVDPDSNFFNVMGANCSYFTEENFMQVSCELSGLSILHINARSLVKIL